MNIERKPLKRSKVRKIIGKYYYVVKRYIDWYFSGKKFSKFIDKTPYTYVIFTSRTPLIRKLKDVDLYLQYNKIINLKIAIEKINGLIIKPGETLSYWRLIGKPSYKKGYLNGLVLNPDGSFKPGVGGGLCQLSNIIYYMTLHTPLTVTERYRHSHDVFPDINRTQPFGTGATCSYPSLDLQIFNNTKINYQLLLYYEKDYLVGEWRSVKPSIYKYEIYEKEHFITASLYGGYIRNNTIYRKIYKEDSEILKDEYLLENHAYMQYAPFISSKSEL